MCKRVCVNSHLMSSPQCIVVTTVVYYHGGGMATSSAFGPQYQRWFRTIARQGVCVIAIDFRNCVSADPYNAENPVAEFPAGLNDCYNGLTWVYQNAEALRVDRTQICIAGESGGGNLTLAVGLKAKAEKTMHMFPRGMFAMCPYIVGVYPQDQTWNGRLGDSHLDTNNNGLVLPLNGTLEEGSAFGALMYSKEAFEEGNPLAWPAFATEEELSGLPRTVISLNECDPLRDEGLLFYRKLIRAGVQARCRQVMGTPHGGDVCVYDKCVPDVCVETASSIANFVRMGNSPWASEKSRL